jgi:hypothetical protein
VRSIPVAIVAGALIASAAMADVTANRADLIWSGLPDLPGWWAEFGRPGWIADSWMSPQGPWVLAGHARGGWDLQEPGRAPRALPEPGPGSADTPLASYDSVVVRLGEGGAWSGFRGALATAYGLPAPREKRGAETVVDLGSGDFAYDDNALMVDRVDSLAWVRGEAMGSNRGAFGSTDLGGRHRWGVSTGLTRGRHQLEGTLSQRGVAARLLDEEEESNDGASGSVTYRHRANHWRGSVTGARGYDHHESFGTFLTSLRDASGGVVMAEVQHEAGLEARVEARREHVSRTESEEFEAATSEAWAVLGLRRPWGDGELSAAVGGGRLGATGDWDVAPSLHYRTAFVGGRAHLGAERVLHGAWSDLAAGQSPFVQSSWVGTAELELGARPQFLRASLLAGRTHNRAIFGRVPLTDHGLRLGQTRDPDSYDFGLLWAEVETQWWRRVRLGGEGFGLVRRSGSAQPRVDPGYGYRGWVETGFRAFKGDLGAVVRVGLEGVGERDSERAPGPVLPGYATTAAQVQLSLASAIVTIRVRNLEDELHEEPWIDVVTDLQALGPGREFRFVLTMLLGN